MKKIILFILLFLLLTSILYAKIYKIAIINSYNVNHICTAPQVNGFLEALSKYEDNYKIKIKSFDMETKLKNISYYQILNVSEFVKIQINNFQPDAIYTTDDNAFIYVGKYLSKKYFVVSSGLNKFPRDYIEEEKLDDGKHKLIFISEYIRLDGLFNLFSQNNMIIKNAYIITENPANSSTTNAYMLKNYEQELRGHLKYKIFIANNISEFRKIVLKLNKKPIGLIIPIIQRLRDESGKYRDKMYIIRELIKLNVKHLEIGGNLYFCKYGLAICNIPDFFNMGFVAGNIISNYLFFNKKLKYCTIINSTNKIAVNVERLKQLGFENLLNKTNLLNKIYEKIYDY